MCVPASLLALLPALTLAAHPATFCDDPAAVADWEDQVAGAPHDPALQALHGLWLGLCAKVRDGSVGLDMAIEIFERERARLALERAREEAGRRGTTGI